MFKTYFLDGGLGRMVGVYRVYRNHQGFSITVCPRSSDPFYIVCNYIKWVTTSWTYSMSELKSHEK